MKLTDAQLDTMLSLYFNQKEINQMKTREEKLIMLSKVSYNRIKYGAYGPEIIISQSAKFVKRKFNKKIKKFFS